MQALRRARYLASFTLVWFVLALGAAIAAPIVQPQSMELICSSGGVMKLVIKDASGGEQQRSHTLDCPLCVHVATPPQPVEFVSEYDTPLSHALRPVVAAHIAGRTAAPLPPRGPPAFS